MKILIVDDEKSFLDQAEHFLKKMNKSLEIDSSMYAEEGLEKVGKNHYDCIISDYKMNEMNGIEFLESRRY